MNKIYVAPSILSADFSNIRDGVKLVEECGADWLHCDVMDGVFVNNITFGAKMIADVRKITKLTIDAHLMICNPMKYVESFAKSGADYITVHYETLSDVRNELLTIKKLGVKVGLAVKPNTPIEVVEPYIDILDMILVMTVEPGFSGQKLIVECLPKFEKANKMIKESGRDIVLQVDGGITEDNVHTVTQLGADCIVSGNTIFKSGNPVQTVKRLKNA